MTGVLTHCEHGTSRAVRCVKCEMKAQLKRRKLAEDICAALNMHGRLFVDTVERLLEASDHAL